MASRGRGNDWVCTGVKKCVETFWNTGRVVGNPGKAVRGVCRSALKRTVMRIWREGTCSSKYKPENGTCWMRTVLAEWERYLQSFQIGWNASDLSYLSIPIWNTTTAYHLRNSVCTYDPWDVLNTIRTCSQATYFYNTPAWIVPEPTVYLSSQEASAVCGNNTSMASFKIAVTPLLTHWSYRCLALSRRHVRENVKDYKTGHCHAECNVPVLWPPSYFEDFLLFILQFAFLWVNRWHFCNVCWEWLTYHTNLFCNISSDTHELIYITAMSDDRHVVSNHRSIDCLFNI